MTSKSWSLVGKRSGKGRAGERARSGRWQRLCLEQLESRVTPSFSFSSLASFHGSVGNTPIGDVVMDSSGNLYGVTDFGGANGLGTVFEIAKGSGTITTLGTFNGGNGSLPHSLIMDASGNLYGTTNGGGPAGAGTVFEVATGSSTITTLASFNVSDGAGPSGRLVVDSSGNLYGTTAYDGPGSYGTVFEVVKGSGAVTTLASFNGGNGVEPLGGLIMDSGGNLYGTTVEGGAEFQAGSIFELAAGSGTITTLASFSSTGTAGVNPSGGLIMDASGNLYGTASAGGANGDGTVFELAKGSGTITTLAPFNGANGADPWAALIMDSSGNLYGTATYGGANGGGTVFELAKGSGTITALASLSAAEGVDAGSDLVMDAGGNLYGAAFAGGNSDNVDEPGDGTVFELAKGSGTITALATFGNGANPFNVIMDGSGNLFGTAFGGGADGLGAVFEVPYGSSTPTTLASFTSFTGTNPQSALIMDGSGNFYGTTVTGGANDAGTVFELQHGTHFVVTLASFDLTDGAAPLDGVVMDSTGNLFGATASGGANGDGTIFEVAKGSNTITVLASFSSASGGGPAAGLIIDAAGNLYGTTNGGANGDGTVFELAKGSGTVTTLATFHGGDGALPTSNLTMDASGNLYGTTEYGGASGDGTVFELVKGSTTITTLASFNQADGLAPFNAPLLLGASGNLYGTTSAGGPSNQGTVFEIAAGSGTITDLISFNGANGANPAAGLVTDASGNLYGTTNQGSTYNQGTLFKLTNSGGGGHGLSGTKLQGAAVFPGAGPAPSGTITFYLFAPGVTPDANYDNWVYTETVPVNNGFTTYTTTGTGTGSDVATQVGTYQWVASYSGDSNGDAPFITPFGAEPATVTPATPTLTTTPSETNNGVVGSAVLGDTANLTGGYNLTSGSITFTLTQPDGTTIAAGTVSVTGDGTYNAPTALATEVGTYTWHASYSGDGSLNNGASDDGTSEALTTIKASPTLTNVASSGVVGSATLGDTAALAGYNETGAITFILYAPDGTVFGVPETVAVSGDGSYSTPTAYTPNVAGSWQWLVSYSGDADNNAAGAGAASTVIGAPQTISFAPLASETYGNAPFALSATASSGLPVSFVIVSGPATLSGNTITLTGAGTVEVEASQAGNAEYSAAPVVHQFFTVNPAPLTITANNQSKAYGQANPPLTASYSGFVNGDTPASLTTPASAATAATTSSPVGSYQITIGGATDPNYNITFVNGTLTIARDATATAGVLTTAAPGFGQAEVIAATVSASPPGSGTPTGSVDFFDSTTGIDLGHVALANGSAALSVSALAVGGHTITLSYAGDGDFLGSTAAIRVAVAPSILVLDPSAAGALTMSGYGDLNIAGPVIVDSKSPTALMASGEAVLSASSINVVGGVSASSGATFSVTPTTGIMPLADPLGGLAAPAAGLSQGAVNLTAGTLSMNPGVYSRISVSGSGHLIMNAGTYVISGGGFSVSGQASVTGTGVMIYNAGSKFPGSGGSFGPFSMSGQAAIDLTAPTTGPYAGIVFFQSRDNTQVLSVSNQAAVSLHGGVVYAPAAALILSGQATLKAADVVDRLQLSGSGTITQAALAATASGAEVPVNPPMPANEPIAVRPASGSAPDSPASLGSSSLPRTAAMDEALSEPDGNSASLASALADSAAPFELSDLAGWLAG